ncbi:potassium transporter TrkA [Picosynechococcus sp. PCC 7003]|uniref:SLC13 family permease n=1 Tax=Picosynechococcus sp. PCC 7003 TaxID=374981 RepID=UPI000810E698|nr:SLC13 family permease [Picosynechococcus sp. PCC 7003]ANV83611.1 potassium transporter TrkA [Picosynechococcus sp. PCC 7003]
MAMFAQLSSLGEVAFFGLGWQGWLTLGLTLVAFLLNALTPLPAEVIFLGALGALLLTGVLDTGTTLAGFSNEGLATIAVLYLVVTGLQQTGSLSWISQRVLGLPKGESAALMRLMVPVMGLSAFLNNTPVVAMFIPVVNEWCRKLRISPSKLMLPLSYAASFGGCCTLIGTSTNLVVNGLLIAETDHAGLGLFDIAWVGFPCAIAGVTFLMLSHRWLLPERKPAISDQDDLRQYTVEMVVHENSPLIGKSIEDAGLRNLPNLYLIEVVRDALVLPAVSPREVLREKDQLVFVGAVDSILDLNRLRGLQPATDQVFKLDTPRSERCLIEAVVSNTCPLIRQTIREGKFRSRYNAVVLAVARNGERLKGKIGEMRLLAGDTLLLETHPTFLEQQRGSRDFYLVSEIPDSEPMRHDRAPLALGILLVMVVCVVLGWLSMLKAATLAAIAMIVMGCCSPSRSLKSIEWPVLLVIGAAFGLGKALEITGAAGAIATSLIQLAGDRPWPTLIVIYGITGLLTELITNNAAAALMFPIALSLADTLGVDLMPFAIAVMLAASASFSTPIGYQTNLMVYGPGGYKFTDYFRVGIPLNLLFWAVSSVLIPLAFPFYP